MGSEALSQRGVTGSTAVRQPRRLRLFFSAVLALAGAALPAKVTYAQTLQIAYTSTDTLPDLRVYLTYLGADGKPVLGQTPAAFILTSDGVEMGAATAVTQFEKLQEPLSVVLITQTSAVVSDKLLAEVKAGFRQINQAVAGHPGSRVSVLSYAVATKPLLEAGGSTEVEAALSKLAVDTNAPESHLLDAMKAAIEMLERQPAGSRKRIVVVSDGIDVSKERKPFAAIGNRAQEAGIVISIVGHNEIDHGALRFLPEITKRARGISRTADTIPDVRSQLANVADEIQKQYVVTFRPDFLGNDKDRAVQVYVSSGPKYIFSNTIVVTLPTKAASQTPPVIKPLRIPPPT